MPSFKFKNTLIAGILFFSSLIYYFYSIANYFDFGRTFTIYDTSLFSTGMGCSMLILFSGLQKNQQIRKILLLITTLSLIIVTCLSYLNGKNYFGLTTSFIDVIGIICYLILFVYLVFIEKNK